MRSYIIKLINGHIFKRDRGFIDPGIISAMTINEIHSFNIYGKNNIRTTEVWFLRNHFNMKMKDIAKIYEVSIERIRQLIAKSDRFIAKRLVGLPTIGNDDKNSIEYLISVLEEL